MCDELRHDLDLDNSRQEPEAITATIKVKLHPQIGE